MNWRRRAPLVLFILPWIFLLVAPGARAARVDCTALLKGAATAGVTPTLYLDPDYGIARLESGSNHCLEPIEEWKRRGLPLKSSGKPPSSQPEAVEAPAQASAPAPKAAPEAVREAILPVPAPQPLEKVEPCGRALEEFWQGTMVAVRGVSYRLVRVYTIDLNSDNRVDDVGFLLKAQGKPDLAISYLGGDLPAATLPELQLSDESIIERLCFESRALAAQGTSAQGIPDLAAELKASMKIKATPKKPGPAKEAKSKGKPEAVTADEESSPWIWVILGLSVLLLAGGGAAWFFLLRGRADDDDDDDEEDEEDEEDDDDD